MFKTTQITCPNKDCNAIFDDYEFLVVGKGNKVTCEGCNVDFKIDVDHYRYEAYLED